jgi:hypothetical protein
MDNHIYAKLMRWNVASIRGEIEKIDRRLQANPIISPTPFSHINSLFTDPDLQNEIGVRILEDGDCLVAMNTPLPDVTAEMIDWWFWWHAQESERYQAWYPGEHFGIGYAKKNKAYFQSPFVKFQENVQYPYEKIGNRKVRLSIAFVLPEKFGLSGDVMHQKEIGTILCGDVGVVKGLIQHTKMMHVFRNKNGGLLLMSRFWIGHGLPRLIKRLFATNKQGVAMAMHCFIEYTRLNGIVPELYKMYK